MMIAGDMLSFLADIIVKQKDMEKPLYIYLEDKGTYARIEWKDMEKFDLGICVGKIKVEGDE